MSQLLSPIAPEDGIFYEPSFQGADPSDPASGGKRSFSLLKIGPEMPFTVSRRRVIPVETSDPPAPPVPSGQEGNDPGPRPEYTGVPKSEARDPSYFSDALFIGDSRTVGLSLYSGISSTYYADTGLNVLTALSKRFLNLNGQSLTILDAVALSPNYSKGYIAFGINEVNWPSTATFIGTYETLLTSLQKLMPDAVFYVQGVIPVSAAVDASDYIKNARVSTLNASLYELAEKCGAYFISLDGLYEQYGGVLPPSLSSDGIHLNRAGVAEYMNWLLTHTVT